MLIRIEPLLSFTVELIPVLRKDRFFSVSELGEKEKASANQHQNANLL